MTVSPGLGLLFLVVAPAGAGKSSLMQRVMKRVEGLKQLPTATTRPIRANEQQGREHLFVTPEEFRRMIDDNALLEHQIIHGRYYGMPRALVEQAMRDCEDRIADIDFKGALAARQQYPDNVILIFIQPPSVETLIARMRARGERESEIARRLVRAPAELASAAECDYLILNDDIEEASEVLYAIVIAERSRRDVLKLRLEVQEPSWRAAAIVLHNGQILTRQADPAFPTVFIRPGEAPDQAALRAVSEQLDIPASAEALVFDELMPDGSVPPAGAEYERQGQREQVTLYYAFRLPALVTPPPGWAWTPQEAVPLPRPVADALTTLPI